uniref:Uncharacterized protein n=1 Tax=Anguilla anguilla TaxID=7936 RepID=A0A0E9TZV3_ANGAN
METYNMGYQSSLLNKRKRKKQQQSIDMNCM